MGSKIISKIEEKFKKQNLPNIEVGDSIKVGVLIQEGNRERTQFSEGVVISKNNSNLSTTITIRKVVQNIGVEKVYLIHSPRIRNIEITRKSKIRRAKLFYLRNRSGKATRLKQKFN
uniref:Large ribosomal subunit protein bL19c n=1 Tax=Caulacanthus okamurae TaxID=152008 RepID=A0A6H1U7J0_9FLOR|nr:50S ribosomal protein L19 [Caulacanthus okamurae]QIZ74625.1 50S ribosomal protein L19 [Caulacanthus okamurae]